MSVSVLTAIKGVQVIELKPNWDARGAFTEVFRSAWETGCRPVQWNLDHSVAGTLRGLHAHRARTDYVTPVWGRLFVSLFDARRSSGSFGRTVGATLQHRDGVAVVLPPGVVHGFYYGEDSAVLIGFSAPWVPTDDIRCHYLAPELGMEWPGTVEFISASDAAAQGYDAFMRELESPGGAA